MDELTLWEIIEGFCDNDNLLFTLEKCPNGWFASFGEYGQSAYLPKVR